MDRRQRKTRKAIYSAFEELVAEHHYREVTVAQIIERADVGRTTFYAHFETKDDLLDSMCTEMFDHVFEGVNTHCITHATLEDDDLPGRLAHLLYHLRDTHSGICTKLLAEGEPRFTAGFKSRLRDLLATFVAHVPGNVPNDYYVEILLAAFLETIAWWFRGGCSDDPEELAGWYAMVIGGSCA